MSDGKQILTPRLYAAGFALETFGFGKTAGANDCRAGRMRYYGQIRSGMGGRPFYAVTAANVAQRLGSSRFHRTRCWLSDLAVARILDAVQHMMDARDALPRSQALLMDTPAPIDAFAWTSNFHHHGGRTAATNGD